MREKIDGIVREKLAEAIDNIFVEAETELGIEDGGVTPFTEFSLKEAEESLKDMIVLALMEMM